MKKEIKNKVLEKLMDLGVLTDPIDSVQPVAGISPEGFSVVGPSSSSVRDDEGGQQVAQATPRGG